LRAFTAKDRKAIRLAAQNFPVTEFYDVAELLTNLGTGEALVTVLNEDGRPSPLVRTMMRAPESRMDVLTPSEVQAIVDNSRMVLKYDQDIDRESAYDILSDKMAEAAVEKEATSKHKKPKPSF